MSFLRSVISRLRKTFEISWGSIYLNEFTESRAVSIPYCFRICKWFQNGIRGQNIFRNIWFGCSRLTQKFYDVFCRLSLTRASYPANDDWLRNFEFQTIQRFMSCKSIFPKTIKSWKRLIIHIAYSFTLAYFINMWLGIAISLFHHLKAI